MTTHESLRTAFAECVNLGDYLRNAEFALGLLPEKPVNLLEGIDLESASVQLIDVRGALGRIALHLAELHVRDTDTLGFIDKTVDSNEYTTSHWTNAEVLQLLTDIRATVTK